VPMDVRNGAWRPVPAFQDERPLSLGKAIFARTRANGREAPETDLRLTAFGLC
jgi:hypothetical protein